MKFNKTILAVAIAGIAAAPVAQAEVTLSGYIGILIIGSDEEDVPADGDDEAEQPGALAMESDDSSLNVAASHELNSGATGYANWRADLGLANDGTAQADNIHLGIKGGFGDIRLGEVPDALEYGQVAGDILHDIGGEERGLSYTNSFGPATIGVNWSPVGTAEDDGARDNGGSDKIAAGIKFALAGFNIGVGVADHDERAKLSAGLSFKAAGFSIALAHKSEETTTVDADRSTLSAAVGYGIGNFSGKVTFATETGDVDEDDVKLRLDLGYGLGGGMKISTRINAFTDENEDGDGDKTDYRVMLQKDF